jgi:hypothetical protein
MIAGFEKTRTQLTMNLDGGPNGLFADWTGAVLDEAHTPLRKSRIIGTAGGNASSFPCRSGFPSVFLRVSVVRSCVVLAVEIGVCVYVSWAGDVGLARRFRAVAGVRIRQDEMGEPI